MAEGRRHPIAHVEPLGVDLEVGPGETIIEAAWRLGYHWPTVCWGQAECTACAVEVLDGDEHLTPIGGDEREALDERFAAVEVKDLSRVRLACRVRLTGDVAVRKPGVRASVAG